MVEFVATMPSRPLGARFVVTLDMLSLAQFEGFAFLTARGDTRRTQPFVIPQIARKFQAERRAGRAGVLGVLVVVQFGSRRVQLRQGSSRTEPFFRRSERSRAGTCQLSTRAPPAFR